MTHYRAFANLNPGDIIYRMDTSGKTCYVRKCRIKQVISDPSVRYSQIVTERDTFNVLRNVSCLVLYGRIYYSTLDELCQFTSKKVLNIISPSCKHIAFYNVAKKEIINNTWYDFKTSKIGFVQSYQRTYGIIEQDGLYNLIDITGKLLTEKWFSKIIPYNKEGYVIGVQEALKTKIQKDTTYKLLAQSVTKIPLPDSTFVPKRAKKTAK